MNVSIVPGGTGSDFAPFPGTSYRATFAMSLRDDLSRRTSLPLYIPTHIPSPLYPDAHRFPYIGPHVRTRGARSLTKSPTGIRRVPLTPGFRILNSSS
jgi:hypothetical protein